MLAVFVMTAAIVAIAGTAQAAQSGSSTFPATPWNGMQVTYTIDGASVGTPSDTTPGAINRAADGELTSHTLHVTGTITLGASGDGYTYSGGVDIAYHKDGDYATPWTHLKTFWDQGSDGKTVSFDLTADAPSDAEIIYLEINETQYSDNVDTHDLYVGINLQNPYYAKSGTGASAAPTDSNPGPTAAAASATSKSDGLAFGTPVVSLTILLAGGLFVARRPR